MLQRVGRHDEAVPALRARAASSTPASTGRGTAWGFRSPSSAGWRTRRPSSQEAARLKPSNAYAGYQLAGVWHRLGQRDKLSAEYERIKGFDPKVAERIRTIWSA